MPEIGKECPTCGGIGHRAILTMDDISGDVIETSSNEACETCEGTGRIYTVKDLNDIFGLIGQLPGDVTMYESYSKITEIFAQHGIKVKE